MSAALIALLTNPAMFIVYAAVIDVLVSAFRDQHPFIAQMLARLADLFRSKAKSNRLPPLAMFLAVLVLPAAAETATAGPIIDRIRERRAAQCQPCSPAPQQFARPACVCNDNCSCKPGECPSKCPVGPQTIWQSGPAVLGTRPQTFVIPQASFPSCPSCSGGNCAIPSRSRR